MTTCFISYNIKESVYIKNKLLYRFVTPKKIFMHLNRDKTYEIICYIMSSCLQLNAYGYNKIENKFWGKKIKHKVCIFQFNLEIIEVDNTSSNIIITPIIGTIAEFGKFIDTFCDCIYIYNKAC